MGQRPKPVVRVPLHISLWAFLSLSLVGCSIHLHSPDDEALAERAREQLAAVIAANRDAFQKMSANLDAMSSHEVAAYDEMAEKYAAIKSRSALRSTWAGLNADWTGEDGALQEVTSERDRIMRDIAVEFVDASQATESAENQLKAASKALAEAKERVTRWNERLSVLEKLIQETPRLTALADSTDLDAFADTAKDIAKELKAEKVTYVDADGKENEKDLFDGVTELFDTNSSLRSGDSERGGVLAGIRAVFNPDAPGLVLTIAALAKDLAEGEQRRARARLRNLEQRRAIALRVEELLERATNLSKAQRNIRPDAPNSPFAEDNIVSETLRSLAEEIATQKTAREEQERIASDASVAPADRDAARAEAVEHGKNEQNARDHLELAHGALQNYVTVSGTIVAQVKNAVREDAYLRHRRSLEESSINASLHEALAARGLEGLVLYHRGGVKQAEIAELLYESAQLAAFGVIASRI